MKISAVIIVKNEELHIGGLCETIPWVDEIVIVDSDSTDRTVEIARQYTANIFNREFRGFKDKHEFADAQATGDWIFWLDADERVTPELAASIQKLRSVPDEKLLNGYKVRRKAFYLGRWIEHSGWYPDMQMRFYRKAGSYWDGVAPHQSARVQGKLGVLDGELLHFTKQDIAEHHHVTGFYAALAAEFNAKNGRRAGFVSIFFKPIFAFLRVYFVRLGFLDGIQGLIIAYMVAHGVFLKNAQLWEARQKQ
ncbi:MAG: glycosyltransferase family 2 protein [Pyrinomonadaceae bacterium]|nr:glycosyltransferase family 2 protein [Pyrinomonadaceae bacterium]